MPGSGFWIGLGLVLIEGFWHTGAGLSSTDLLPVVQARTTATVLRVLSNEEDLWGGPVADERYLVTGTVGSSRPDSTITAG